MLKKYLFVYNLRLILAIFLVFSSPELSFSQISETSSIDDMEYSWLGVLSGSALTKPVKTSYGYAVLTDGRMINAFNEEGKILWQHGINGRPSPYLSVTQEDFLLTVVLKSNLTLINPSGLQLWSKDSGFEITKPPLEGRDGRIFIFGEKEASAFGFNGIQKWTVETDPLSRTLMPCQLNDGSLLVFLEEENDGRTVARRINPFGVLLEKITFSGKVLNASSHKNGVFLVFSSGETGICSAKDITENSTYSLWVSKTGLNGKSAVIFPDNTEIVYGILSAQGLDVLTVNAETGTVLSSFNIPEIKNSPLIFNVFTDFIVSSDSRNLVLYSKDGKPIKSVKLPDTGNPGEKSPASDWNHLLFSLSGNLLLTTSSWNLVSYRIYLNNIIPQKKTDSGNYREFYDAYQKEIKFTSDYAKSYRKDILLEGNYGSDEIQLYRENSSVLENYLSAITTSSSPNGYTETELDTLFNYDANTVSKVISMHSLFGTETVTKDFSRLLNVCNNEVILTAVLKQVQNFGYDPKEELLDSLELLIRRTSPRQTALIDEEIKAVFEISSFMGRPLLVKKGKALLSVFTGSQYSLKNRNTVRHYFTLLAGLKM